MLTQQARLLPNGEGLATKIFDGEAIIINLSTGVYYSMENVGAMIWQMVEEGCSVGEIVAGITARYDVSIEQAEADAERLTRELLQEDLVKVSEPVPRSKESLGARPQSKLRYESPSLTIYRDIAEVWAFDPPVPLRGTVWEEGTDGPPE